jgi:hypothetical protein
VQIFQILIAKMHFIVDGGGGNYVSRSNSDYFTGSLKD